MDDRLVEAAGRYGLLSRAALWLVMAALAVRLAFERAPEPGAQPDKSGALQILARQRVGAVLLALLIAAFSAMVVWSVVEALRRRDGDRTSHPGHRAAAAGRAVVYASLAVSAVPLLFDDDAGGGDTQERLTVRVLGWPGGRFLVGAVAAALFAAAAYNLYRAVSRRFERNWDRTRMDRRAEKVAGPLEIVANAGHAVVFGVVGWFLAQAAWRFDANEPKSLDESLAVLVRQSNGRALCLLVALGMAAWGLNAVAQAKWRQVPAEG